MTPSFSDDDLWRLHAAIDGELDAAGMLDIERRLAADPALAAEYAKLRALQNVIRARVGYEAAPDSLRARILALANVNETSNRVTGRLVSTDKFRWAVAAVLAAILVTAVGAYRFLPADDDIADAVVAGHIRGQLSDQPVDVASSDRHAVKPWLAGKVPLATVVVDLAGEGFPLAGGRVDIVRGAAVPTLVYRRREHLVSVTELAPNRYPTTPRRETIGGYPVLAWSDGQRSYLAVSDLPAAEVEGFVVLFRRAVASEQEGAPSPH